MLTAQSARPSGRLESEGTGVRILQFGLKSKPVKQSQAPSVPLAPALAGGAENICGGGGEKPQVLLLPFFCQIMQKMLAAAKIQLCTMRKIIYKNNGTRKKWPLQKWRGTINPLIS